MISELKNSISAHHLAIIRDKNTSPAAFRHSSSLITKALLFSAQTEFPTEFRKLQTPLESTECEQIDESQILFVSILRAGNAMLSSVFDCLPEAAVGHLGLYRDEKHEAVEYYVRIPNKIEHALTVLLDPMLATGGSAIHAIDVLKQKGAQKIIFLNILSAPEGVERSQSKHPDVSIYTAKIDRELNEKAYILPGLGDAGDRYYHSGQF